MSNSALKSRVVSQSSERVSEWMSVDSDRVSDLSEWVSEWEWESEWESEWVSESRVSESPEWSESF